MEKKIIFNKEVLQKAIETAKKVVKSRPVVPILENYLLIVEPGKVSIIAGDLQNYIEVQLDGGYEMRPQTKFKVVLTPDTLTFLKKMELQPITLEAFEERTESYPYWSEHVNGEFLYFDGGSQQERDKFLERFEELKEKFLNEIGEDVEQRQLNVAKLERAQTEFEERQIRENVTTWYTITDEDGTAKYNSEDPGDFPKVPETEEEVLILAPGEIAEFKGLAGFMSKDELRPAMCGIHLGWQWRVQTNW